MDEAKISLLEVGYMVMSITNIQNTRGTVSEREIDSISYFLSLRYLSGIQEEMTCD